MKPLLTPTTVAIVSPVINNHATANTLLDVTGLKFPVQSGKRYAFTPKDSLVAGLAREHNVIEWVQFGGARDLVAAAKLARDPKQAAALKDDADYQALAKDPRFRQLLQGDAFKKALETGDVRGLMQNNQLGELVHDAKLGRHLERLAARAP